MQGHAEQASMPTAPIGASPQPQLFQPSGSYGEFCYGPTHASANEGDRPSGHQASPTPHEPYVSHRDIFSDKVAMSKDSQYNGKNGGIWKSTIKRYLISKA